MRSILLFTLLLSQALYADDDLFTMWQIEGTSNRIYLLGSVHLLRESDHPLPAMIDAAYKDAEALVMEIDMDDIDPIQTQTLVTSLGVLRDGASLEDLMGQQGWQDALAAAEAVDIPLDLLNSSEPWLAAITVEEMLLMRIGFNPLMGVEMHLMQRAMRDNKEISGLETIEEQLRFLDELSLEAQREMLLQTLLESADIESLMDELINAWRNGDVDFMEETMLADMQQYTELYEVIVAERNRRWIAAINEYMTHDDDYLIIVGALHLVGDEGVPSLLRKQGTEIKQLPKVP
jgi:uncharacterized protein YbaP (TraB family)